jgi:hypothetical protein
MSTPSCVTVVNYDKVGHDLGGNGDTALIVSKNASRNAFL